jgi:hypothetical protein
MLVAEFYCFPTVMSLVSEGSLGFLVAMEGGRGEWGTCEGVRRA